MNSRRFICKSGVIKRSSRERCDCDGYWFPHRMSSGNCKFDKHGVYKVYDK